MNTKLLTAGRWVVRIHLVGLGFALGYGLHHGDLFAPFQQGILSLLYHPAMVGLSIGSTGVASTFINSATESAQGPYQHDTISETETDEESKIFADYYEDQMRRDEAEFGGYLY